MNCAVKQRWMIVTDPADIAALKEQGKYREHLPMWVRDGDQCWAQADDFRKWKLDRIESSGKRL